ncbi:MAG: hypothetical protein L0Y39_05225 [Methylococcaceae bacterium]|nr:hypothetical protein [Methylococcaceae bacterium]
MNNAVTIKQVDDKQALLEFVEFPFKLYKHDSNWVPPFIRERLEFFDVKKNPFYEHARYRLFLAYRNGDLAGTIGAVVDDNHNQAHNERCGAFGFFECINDQEVAGSLLNRAEDWIRGQGMTLIRGPLNFSVNHECGLLIDGFDEPPMVMMTYNPRYYQQLINHCGYQKKVDLFAYIGNIGELWENAPASLFRIAENVAEREGIRVRTLDLRDMNRENLRIREVYNRSFGRQWGFVPMNEKECEYFSELTRKLADPNLILIAENQAGEAVGVSLALPDFHQALRRSGGGRLFPFGLLKFLWYLRKVDQIRLIAMGVLEQYRNRGIDAIFWVETARAARAHGYKRLECSWVLEENEMMNTLGRTLRGKIYKTYQILEKRLSTP